MVVPSADARRLLARLLDSLRRQTTPHDVIVVDNGSKDGTAQLLEREYPEVHVLRLANNAGFGRAVNAGVAASSAEVVVLLNNDAVCEPQFLVRLVAALDPARGVVMAAGVLLRADDPGTVDTAGIQVDSTLLAFDYLKGEPASALEHAVDPLGPCGGAAAYDRVSFDRVGGFDEHFFAYLEDVDLALRLRAAGGRCRLAGDARALHRHAATLGAGSRRKNELMGWGRGYMIGKYRLHRRPSRFARAMAGELAIAGGQLLIDRTAIGFRARVQGFHAGLRVDRQPAPPPETVERVSLASALGRRFTRRRRTP